MKWVNGQADVDLIAAHRMKNSNKKLTYVCKESENGNVEYVFAEGLMTWLE